MLMMQPVTRGNRTLPEEEGSEMEDRYAAEVPPCDKFEVLPPVDVAHALHSYHSHYSCHLHQTILLDNRRQDWHLRGGDSRGDCLGLW